MNAQQRDVPWRVVAVFATAPDLLLTSRELCELIGFAGRDKAFNRFRPLVERGYLTRSPGDGRSLVYAAGPELLKLMAEVVERAPS